MTYGRLFGKIREIKFNYKHEILKINKLLISNDYTILCKGCENKMTCKTDVEDHDQEV